MDNMVFMVDIGADNLRRDDHERQLRQQRERSQVTLSPEQALALTNYLMAHRNDIECGINDFDDLRSLLSLIRG